MGIFLVCKYFVANTFGNPYFLLSPYSWIEKKAIFTLIKFSVLFIGRGGGGGYVAYGLCLFPDILLHYWTVWLAQKLEMHRYYCQHINKQKRTKWGPKILWILNINVTRRFQILFATSNNLLNLRILIFLFIYWYSASTIKR